MKTAWIGCTATVAKPHASGHCAGEVVSVKQHNQCLIHSTNSSQQEKKHASFLKRAKHQTTVRNLLTNSKKWVTAKCGVQAQQCVLCVPNKRRIKPLFFFLLSFLNLY